MTTTKPIGYITIINFCYLCYDVSEPGVVATFDTQREDAAARWCEQRRAYHDWTRKLNDVMELFVSRQQYDEAASVRDLMDKLKGKGGAE